MTKLIHLLISSKLIIQILLKYHFIGHTHSSNLYHKTNDPSSTVSAHNALMSMKMLIDVTE